MKTAMSYTQGLFLSLLLTLAGTAMAQQGPLVERPGVADMLENVTDAVVNISVTSSAPVAGPQQQNPLLEDPFFRRFFDVPDQQQPQPQQRRPRASVGSGVIINAEEGLILTNHHVVQGAEMIEVNLLDRRQIPAELVGSDPGTDIALLRVEADNLREIPLADSETLRTGDFVVAIGNPFGIGQTVTTGIVSALGRAGGIIAQGQGYEDFIQTDASINPGNSGGALVDFNGRLIGINTAIIAPSGGNVGIGFAVPINMARSVVDQLMEYGEVSRGLLGVLIQDLTPEVANILGLDIDRGAVVSQVQPDSAADRAGIASGDVITAVDGEGVRSSRDLRNTVGLLRPGTEVEITLVRDGDSMMVNATLGQGGQQVASGPSQITDSNFLQGAELRNIPSNHPQYGEVQGVLVSSVEQGGRAAQNGLQPNDIIIEANRQSVASVAGLMELVRDNPQGAAVRVLRNGQVLFLVMR